MRRHSSLEGFDLVAVVAKDNKYAGSLRQRRHDLARETQDGGFDCRAVPDDQGAAIIGQAVEDAAERGAEPLRVFGDELRVDLAQCLERAASRLLAARLSLAPARTSRGAQCRT